MAQVDGGVGEAATEAQVVQGDGDDGHIAVLGHTTLDVGRQCATVSTIADIAKGSR